MKSKLIQNLNFFLKGMLMGIADLVPGISGGTIAFITGIYVRLIHAITELTPKNFILILKDLFRKDFKSAQKKFIEFSFLFLLLLFAGIFTSIILGSKLIHYLYLNFNSELLIFFSGLILASSKIIFKEIDKHNSFNIVFGIGGILLGLSLLYITPLEILNPSYLTILFGGFLAVFALFLPGVSGSFILLVFGLYGFIIDSLQNIISNLDVFLVFGVGAILGMVIISRLIKYLFKENKSLTLYVLLGLVLGSLSIPLTQAQVQINPQNFYIHLILFILGIISVILIEKLSNKLHSSTKE